MPHPGVKIVLSVIAPAHNERENISELVMQLTTALSALDLEYEFIIVDDASDDGTLDILKDLQGDEPRLRVLHLPPRFTPRKNGRANGQSMAFWAGFHHARGELIATLDADLQNDPADIPRLLEAMTTHDADLVQGDRSRNRKDGFLKRISSVIGRVFRWIILGDTIRDTGCSLRIMKRDVALALPLEYRGMHRFIPITARQMGYKVIEIAVDHRPRRAGKTKYGNLSRALPGLIDCFAVRWMRNRRCRIAAQVIEAGDSRDQKPSVNIEVLPLRKEEALR